MGQIIYMLTNEAMPNYIKIGKTSSGLEQRVGELSRATGVPLPFEVYYACEVEDMDSAEKNIHDAFLDYRVNPKREFFKMNPERVVSVLKLIKMSKDITPANDIVDSQEELAALDIARSRRPKFNFEIAHIPVGSEIKFYYDQLKIAVVENTTEIKLDGVTGSLNKITLDLLAQTGRVWKSVQGPAYWIYNGETLDERRVRIESNSEN
jgi:hypothetical protein